MNEDTLYRYVTGQSNESEKAEVERLSLESEEFRKELNRLQNIWILAGIENELDDEFIQVEIEKILSRIEVNPTPNRIRMTNLSILKYAAVLVVAVLVSGTIGYFASNIFSRSSTSQTTEVIVARGERSTVVLPDGSEVKINSGSTLRFPASFNGSKREVSLVGEAFFSVKKNPDKPFVVESGKLKVEVLGTQFNQCNYCEECVASTYLKSGKVKLVLNGKERIYMSPNDLVRVDNRGHYEKVKVADDYYMDWTRGIFTVRGETIESLAIRLERLFDIQVHFGDEEVRRHTYSGSMKDDNLGNILEALEYASSLKYKWNEKNRKVTFYSR
ncbi:FecR family protein [Mangrovibacterium lignilyticum]|uniref:FecR family protein n=1 Tax=Mangrovibacterium lignilyticum TaxID=2668052 RepID=UPI0013D55853|nr:FecR domain-containing protein [Mangrovibacterium lignilyticum]